MPKLRARGFTLIELLVVIGILAVLLAITLVAINPARQFAQSNDTKRQSDVNAILNAVNQYMVDNSGQVPGAITSTPTEISNAGANLCGDLVPTYIAALPADPTNSSTNGEQITDCAGAYETGYSIFASASGRITVQAVGEVTPDISVTR